MRIQSLLHKQNIRRLAAAVLSLMLIMTALAGIRPAYAEAGESVTQTSIDVAMLTGRNGTIMDRTVELQIQPTGAVKASEGSTVAIRSSIEEASGTPTISSVTFSHTDATVTSYEGIAIGANQKASVKQAVIDFSDVEFAGPGIYRYYVSEPTEGGNLTYDTQRQDKTNGVASRRTLDVYVLRYDDPQTGEVSNYIAGYVLHELDDLYEREAGTAADKSVGFVNEPALSNITLACKIVGNQAAIEKYFAFNIRIQSPSGAPFTTGVDWTEAAEALNPVPNPATSYDFDDIKAAYIICVICQFRGQVPPCQDQLCMTVIAADDINDILAADDAQVCQAKDLIQDQNVAFADAQDLPGKVHTVADIDGLFFAALLGKVLIIALLAFKAEHLNIRFKVLIIIQLSGHTSLQKLDDKDLSAFAGADKSPADRAGGFASALSVINPY